MIDAVPIVSVVLPVHNGDRYLADAIDSVLSQSFADFELIIIDDGSTGRSAAIVRQYQHLDRRIRFVSREHRGLAATLNESMDLARGRWIARMDCDDIALPRRFERQLQWLERTGADICGTWSRNFGTSDRRVVRHPQSDRAIKMALLFGAPFVHPSVMMKATVARELRYDPAWDKAEDYDLWERAARAGCRMTNVPEVLLQYRKHAAQVSSGVSGRQQELTRKIQERYWRFVFDGLHLDSDWIGEILKIRDPSASAPNMDHVDRALAALLRLADEETRQTIFDHATRLYYRVAADCPDGAARWSKLHREFGAGNPLGTKTRLRLLRVLRIRSQGALFHGLKNWYVSLMG